MLTTTNNNIVLARPINGVTVNGLEFLLNEDKGPSASRYLEFETKEEARTFIRTDIFPDSTDEEQDDYFTFMTVDEAVKYEGVLEGDN